MIRLFKFKSANLLLAAMILLLAFGTLSFAQGQRFKGPDAWSFGVHGDTQWTLSSSTNSQHTNKSYVNGELIDLLNQQFIGSHGVKFVIQVGDLTDRSGDSALAERAKRALSLYDAGIGFFPLRGNHETYGQLYGYDPLHNLNVPAFRSNFPQTQGISNTFGATNFSSPNFEDLKGLSYSFDFDGNGNNARFVIVDVEQTSFISKEAEYNPESCVNAVTPGTPEGTTPFCGQSYFYFLNTWLPNYDSGLVVYQAIYAISNGVTKNYDSAGNATTADVVPTIIPVNAWFYIDNQNRPSTDFLTWDMANPDQMYNGAPFDIIAPPSDPANRKLSVTSSANTEYWPGQQQEWISERLDKATRGTKHAFVFSHRPLMGADHVDGFFGINPSVTPDDQNAFYASLYDNQVKYMISAHDHIYNRALLESPNGESGVEQLISIGASTKFYSPAPLTDFAGAKGRETQISQEINTVGYYVYTVDGPRVTVDYYADATGNLGGDYCYPRGIRGNDNPYRSCANKPGTTTTVDGVTYQTGPLVPGTYHVTATDFNFIKKETWGYSLNGQQFLIGQGDSYTVVEDSFGETAVKILAGTNNSTATDLTPDTPRALIKTVNTGWVGNPAPDKLKSDILSLWGMSELGAYGQADTYVLSMSFDFREMVHLGNGGIGIATYVDGQWVNAVNKNFGGAKKFIVGPYKAGYGLGTYGVDPSSKTAWAVLNYDADFAVAGGIEVVPGKRK
jgi:hypothetical protein